MMFMGHLVRGPNDIKVYGRAVARAYEEGRDDAGAEDVARRPWLERWPHFIRVEGMEFVAGVLGDGVSLAELMTSLGPMPSVRRRRMRIGGWETSTRGGRSGRRRRSGSRKPAPAG